MLWEDCYPAWGGSADAQPAPAVGSQADPSSPTGLALEIGIDAAGDLQVALPTQWGA